MKTDYLSPEWLEMYKYTVNQGETAAASTSGFTMRTPIRADSPEGMYYQMPKAYNQGAEKSE